MSAPFRQLGLGGGGVKGVLHVGALRELSRRQPLFFPDGVFGVSVGAIMATYVAFGLPVDDSVSGLVKKYLSLDAIVPSMTFQNVSAAFASKGLYDMDVFERAIADMFAEAGLDVRGKTLGDARMPLFIVASNITKGAPAVFSGAVPVMDALRCSCCVPGLFKPQELYGQLYVDGGLLAPCLSALAPDALVMSLSGRVGARITPETLGDMGPLEYMRGIFAMSMAHFHDAQMSPSTLRLFYPGLASDSDLDEFDVEKIQAAAARQLRDFLGPERAL